MRVTEVRSQPATGSQAEPIAEVRQVSYAYPGAAAWALKDISLTVRRGELLGVIGPTGAGKTTLCLLFNGIVPQFYGGRFFGRAAVAGLDTLEQPVSRLAAHVGMVFEDPETQITATTVEDEVAFAIENLQVPRDEIAERIPWALDAVRLTGMERRHPHELSGGEKQRLTLAAALALRPALMVLDEPTAQLDPVGRQELFATIRTLVSDHRTAVVLVSHAAEEMVEFADRIAMVADGRVVAQGAPEEVYRRVDLLEHHGVRPPQTSATFHRLGGVIAGDETPVRFEPSVAAMADMIGCQRAAGAARDAEKPAEEPFESFRPTERTNPAPILAVRDLHHVYEDGTVALTGVNLDVYPGDYLAIVGQNGAGKSTLVKHFLRVLEPTAGRVLLQGRDLRGMRTPELAGRIGYVAQNPDHQIFNATIEAEVAFALEAQGYNHAEIDARVDRALAAMGLDEARQHHPLSLPRGDRARVVIAAVLAMAPDILIFDEPTTGQDDQGARQILDVTRELHRAGKTIIVITHHLHLMPDYAERVVVMGAGNVLLDAPIREAYAAVDVLAKSYLTPPQVVRLYAALTEGPPVAPPLTPGELAHWLEEKRRVRKDVRNGTGRNA